MFGLRRLLGCVLSAKTNRKRKGKGELEGVFPDGLVRPEGVG